MGIIKIICALFLPPLAVFLHVGVNKPFIHKHYSLSLVLGAWNHSCTLVNS